MRSQTGSQPRCEDASIVIEPLVLSEELVFHRWLWDKPRVFSESTEIKVEMKVPGFGGLVFFFFWFGLFFSEVNDNCW